MPRLFAVSVLLLVVGMLPAADPSTPARVLLIRHAEKPPDDENSVHLSADGKKRAEALSKLFEKTKERPDPFPTPDAIFAAADSLKSHRPTETVAPLAKQLKLTVNAEFKNADFAKLAAHLRDDPKLAGKTVLVCWRHGDLPALLKEFYPDGAAGGWKDEVFDRVWEVRWADGKPTFSDRPMKLMHGDAHK